MALENCNRMRKDYGPRKKGGVYSSTLDGDKGVPSIKKESGVTKKGVHSDVEAGNKGIPDMTAPKSKKAPRD